LARIAGIDIPKNKRVEIGLTYVFGIGRTRSVDILKSLNIDLNTRVKDLTDAQVGEIKNFIEDNYKVEGELRKTVQLSIDRLRRTRCYRGIMRDRGLPVNGQRTRTNARTRKGPSKTPVKSKQKVKK